MSNPVSYTAIVSARERQIPDQCLKSSFFTISSELGFCVRDDSSGSAVLHIIYANDQSKDTKVPMKADAAILNPENPDIVVLRTPQLLQAMDIA